MSLGSEGNKTVLNTSLFLSLNACTVTVTVKVTHLIGSKLLLILMSHFLLHWKPRSFSLGDFPAFRSVEGFNMWHVASCWVNSPTGGRLSHMRVFKVTHLLSQMFLNSVKKKKCVVRMIKLKFSHQFRKMWIMSPRQVNISWSCDSKPERLILSPAFLSIISRFSPGSWANRQKPR